MNEYKKTHDKDLKARIQTEVDFTEPIVKRVVDRTNVELKRTDLDDIERYLYEKARDEATILHKYFTALDNELQKA